MATKGRRVTAAKVKKAVDGGKKTSAASGSREKKVKVDSGNANPIDLPIYPTKAAIMKLNTWCAAYRNFKGTTAGASGYTIKFMESHGKQNGYGQVTISWVPQDDAWSCYYIMMENGRLGNDHRTKIRTMRQLMDTLEHVSTLTSIEAGARPMSPKDVMG